MLPGYYRYQYGWGLLDDSANNGCGCVRYSSDADPTIHVPIFSFSPKVPKVRFKDVPVKECKVFRQIPPAPFLFISPFSAQNSNSWAKCVRERAVVFRSLLLSSRLAKGKGWREMTLFTMHTLSPLWAVRWCAEWEKHSYSSQEREREESIAR